MAKILLGSVLSPGIWYNILRGVAKVAVIINVREITLISHVTAVPTPARRWGNTLCDCTNVQVQTCLTPDSDKRRQEGRTFLARHQRAVATL